MTLSSRLAIGLPWVTALGVAIALILPFLPLWVKAVGVVMLLTGAVTGVRFLTDAPDHLALAAGRRDTAQFIVNQSLQGEGPGHALHLRSGDGTDAVDASERWEDTR